MYACMYAYLSDEPSPMRSGCLSALLAAEANPQPNAFTSAAMPAGTREFKLRITIILEIIGTHIYNTYITDKISYDLEYVRKLYYI